MAMGLAAAGRGALAPRGRAPAQLRLDHRAPQARNQLFEMALTHIHRRVTRFGGVSIPTPYQV